MNQKTREQFRELYKLLLKVDESLNGIPVGQLNAEQRQYLNNAKVLNTISTNTLTRIANIEKEVSSLHIVEKK
ncbi:MAG: hypothetical protein ACP5D6_06305 [Kosmotogaceae bacterium]